MLRLSLGIDKTSLRGALRRVGAKVTDSGAGYFGEARCARCRRRIRKLFAHDGRVYGERCIAKAIKEGA
jgi:hypothetical protein